MKTNKYNVAVVGATGLIGRKFLEVLERRRFPAENLRAFASEKSVNKKITAFGKEISVESLENLNANEIDFAFFSAGKETALKYAPLFAEAGATVIDNSSTFRNFPDIPLVIPEINGSKIKETDRIIANPNCSTIIALTPLKNIINKYGLKRIIFSTYQAVSGSGIKGVKDLLLTRHGFSPEFYDYDISETCIPIIGEILRDGFTEEERKMINETKKITGLDVEVSATCVRVPIENCHGVSVEIETEKPVDIETVIKDMEYSSAKFSPVPVANKADGKDEVLFGRIRKSNVFENGFSYFAVGDNTLKGAALNAVQIAELIIEKSK